MKFLKIIAWVALIALIVIQFFPVDKNESYTTLETDFMMVNKVPLDIENQLKVSCYDCHSNNTAYPWYSKIQPAGWFLENHIKEGKAELNFNEWSNYSDRRKKSKLRSIIKQVESGEMPMNSYTLMHQRAILDSLATEKVLHYMSKIILEN
ncbi:heme-binding domain-containing protein [Aquimarina agarilytica]|uniref:heme-binding domain-containing protein n=1 Tax=Aquimarina agarilytica TaxID=1087449 RepID=UPI00028A1417|nr:heme-binding domain-containing protein [Aquimarina agarilytica]